MIVDNDTVVMGSEPLLELTIDMAYELYADAGTEQALADVYSLVENKAMWQKIWRYSD